MSRSLVSADELLEILNRKLKARADAVNCVIIGPIKPLETPFPDGGNWDRSLTIHVTIRDDQADPYATGQLAHKVVEEVAQEYNLSL
jgi:hypothetical protein